MSDHPNNAAAVAAGYQRIQEDRGAGNVPRFVTRYEKWMVGEPGESGFLLKQEGHSQVSQAAADTIALDALNGWRRNRYGVGSAVNSGSRPAAGQLTTDLH